MDLFGAPSNAGREVASNAPVWFLVVGCRSSYGIWCAFPCPFFASIPLDDSRGRQTCDELAFTLTVHPLPLPSMPALYAVGAADASYAVWFGGSLVASGPEFYRVCCTKAQYDEEGPRIAR